MTVRRLIFLVSLFMGLGGCALGQHDRENAAAGPTITMPLFPGWFDGQLVYYVTTDAWPQQAAIDMGVNYAPRLRHSLPPRPKPPSLKTVVERIYVFPNGEQPSILPSSPTPLGPYSENLPYSPVWELYEITWLEPQHQRELISEGAMFEAKGKGWIAIEATQVVVNCAVVADGEGKALANMQVHGLSNTQNQNKAGSTSSAW